MFEKILFKNAVNPLQLLDVGAIAEALIFYRKVAVLGNTATVAELLTKIPPFVALSLLEQGRLEFHYLSDQIGVQTTASADGLSKHALIKFSSPQHVPDTGAAKAFQVAAGGTSQAKLGARRFSRLLLPASHALFDQASLLENLCDPVVLASVPHLVSRLAPDFRWADARFCVTRASGYLQVETNLDFADLNRHYHQRVPPSHSTVTEAYLLAFLQGSYEALYFAGHLETEVAVDPMERLVQEVALDSILRKRSHSEGQLSAFSELTLGGTRVIREAVNSGKVPFSDVLKLLDKADRFREWLDRQPIDCDLVAAFYQATISESWAQRLPTKATRWGVFTGLGLAADALGASGVGTAAGAWLGAIDTFLVDKLIHGWRPHQFVENTLRPAFKSPHN